MIGVILICSVLLLLIGLGFLLVTDIPIIIPTLLIGIGFTVGVTICAWYSDSKEQVQLPKSQGEIAIIRTYDKNENLINEWRVEK